MKLLFAGDLCPFDGYSAQCSEQLQSLIQEADYSFANLECPLTTSNDKIKKCGPAIKASPDQIETVKTLGFNCVTLANNHLKDFGAEGLLDTLRVCETAGLKTVGAGKNLTAARRPLVIETSGLKVAVLNFAEKEFSCATEDSAGVNPFDIVNILCDIGHAYREAQRIVVVVHGGLEGVERPSPRAVKLLRFIAEQPGVAAVIRHHPHCVQGVEWWKGVPIVYSLGNFFFPWSPPVKDPKWYKGLVVAVDITDKTCEVKSHGCEFRQRDNGPVSVTTRSVTESLEIDLNEINQFWDKEFKRRKYAYLEPLYWTNNVFGRTLSKLRVLQVLPGMQTRMLFLLNCVRNESHSEALCRALDE